jgi:hypothetical protein
MHPELDVATVAWGHRHLGKFVFISPFKRDMFTTDGFPNDVDRYKHNKERRLWISCRELHHSNAYSINAQFLTQFATNGSTVGFTRLALATREFPQSTVTLLRWALAH